MLDDAALPRRRATAPRGSPAAAGRCRCARARPLKRWRYVGVYGPGADAVRGHGARRRRAAGLLGGVGPRRRGALRERTGLRPRRRRRCPTARCASPTATSHSTSRSSPPASRSRSSAATARAYDLDAQARRCAPAGTVTLDGRRVARRRARPGRRLRRLPRARAPRGTGRRGRAPRRPASRSRGTSSPASTTRRARSERTVWVDGAPREVGPVALRRRPRRASATCASAAEAERARRDDLLACRQRLPPAVRHVRRHAARRRRAGRGLRRHGAPPRALVNPRRRRPDQAARGTATTRPARPRAGPRVDARKASRTCGSKWRPAWLVISAIASADAPGRLVRPRMGERVEDVGDRHDAPDDRDRVAGQAGGVAAAVPLLVVGQRDLLGHLEQRERAAGEHLRADRGVGLHLVELLDGQLAPLAQDRVGDRDLADVVQRRGEADQLDLGGGQPQVLGDGDRQVADAARVLAGVVVAELGGRARRASISNCACSSSRLVRRASVTSSIWPKSCATSSRVVADRRQRDARLDDPPAAVQVALVEALRVGGRSGARR